MFGMFDSLDPLKTQGTQTDDVTGEAAKAVEAAGSLDIVALNADIQNMRKAALFVVWALANAINSNDLDAEDGELPSDRLAALIAGFSASDEDDEGVEVDENTYDIFVANLHDALLSLGVDEDVVNTMLSEEPEADDAIEVAVKTITENTPEGDDLQEFIDLFVFGEAEEDEGQMLDGVSLGKTTTKSGKFGKIIYKAVKAIRNGKVSIVNKRMSGRVKLSAKQKNALNKARRKAGTGAALNKRSKSLKKHARVLG